jgi:hypothetical protein
MDAEIQPQTHTKIRAGEITLYGCPLADGEAVLPPESAVCPFCNGELN